MKVLNRLSESRTPRGLRTAELTTKIVVGRKTVYAVEAGLAQAFGVTVEELFQLEARTNLRIEERAEPL